MPFRIEKKDSNYQELREFFNMKGFPTVVVLAADGAELDRMVGFGGDANKFIATMEDWSQNKNTIFSFLKKWQEDSTDVEWNYHIAMRYVDRFQTERAQRFFQNVLTLDPQDNAGYKKSAEFNLALNKARTMGNPDDLAKALENETDPERMRLGYFSLARVYENKNDVTNTISIYKTALEKMPNDAGLMNAAGWFIYEQKASEYYDWGIEITRKAVELEPQDSSIWDTLAWLLHSNGQYQEALDAMTKVAEIEPESDYLKQTLQKLKNDVKANS